MDNPSPNHSSPETLSSVVPAPKAPKAKFLAILIILLVLIASAGAVYYFIPKSGQEVVKKTAEEITKPKKAVASGFATYEEVPVNNTPKIPAYSVDPDLSNVVNADDFSFSDEAEDLLIKNAFVVTPGYSSEFFEIYESNRYAYTPNFVTTDSMLHNYHLMFDFLLKQLEEQKLAAELKQLNAGMFSETLTQYNSLKGTEWENAAKRNLGFFAVGSNLLDSSVTIPPEVSSEVSQELALIEAHEGIKKSPVMGIGGGEDILIETPQGPQPLEALKEDYSQYVPRGHYDKTEQLKAYFKSMMWYGRLTFRMKYEDEIKSAILITLALNKESNQVGWDKIYEPVNFFVGKSDDITYYQFLELVEKSYGVGATPETVSTDKTKFASFVELTKTLEPPQINSMPIFEASIQADREEEIKGFRFMGQRFTIDASIFQRLLYREVGDKTKSCQSFSPGETGCLSGARCLPKGLDIPSAMGSSEALSILEGLGETEYACYPENMSKMKAYVGSLPTETWTQNLYWGWLYQLLPLTEEKPNGYPTFMQNSAWARKELNTYLGSWTELKHDTILYAKQVYAELGGGGGPEKKDDRGYVEPNLYVYARLASLLKMTSEGLTVRELLSENMKADLNKLEQLALSLKTISEKELNNENLTDAEYELIRSYGGQLESFWIEINKNEPQYKELGKEYFLDQNPAAIVADVATDPNGEVLEEGTGKIYSIYVVFPLEGKLRIAEGGVYSYYEFMWPLSDRLTDTKWRELLNSGKAPELPGWTSDFVAK
ncbi:hypothetical protein COT51_04040 [candidate division WWE3 bacterium CG08_land_8_20_14_0_20_41_15]|uniref:DUF3160 domain-containing protein n=1 Tax=candidate division WWE3 bacterium CG08_land_8_20_14_0_20_41_15 TaxID=1975086 RepID=A0A2H0XAJ8_UNCKA|nr:MAG: hypothetical protein COT51_04040 [candidate division WWE3 bacterium CG08_land_8_20_14_0_20_41_15]